MPSSLPGDRDLALPGTADNKQEGDAMSIDEMARILGAHYASMTPADEIEIDLRSARGDDAAELALRTCSCGRRLNGFYEYSDHLKEVLTRKDV
jgi:hypothetical protein